MRRLRKRNRMTSRVALLIVATTFVTYFIVGYSLVHYR